MKKATVAVGLSGGVDSALSAALLKQAGYRVTGVYLECYRENGCRSDQDRQDALAVALHLGIPFQSLDFRGVYKEKVLAYFYQRYQQGDTPNPDLLCNREIKFGLFANWAQQQGFDHLATGHYAAIKQGRLHTSVDTKKDQSYFLSLVAPAIWQRVIFPLNQLTKQQVRQKARDLGLPNSDKKDSMGICFVGKVAMRDFLQDKVQASPGEVVLQVDGKKKVVGEHRGLPFYTLGQRHGFDLRLSTTNAPAYYVQAKDWQRNQLLIADKAALMTKQFSFQALSLNFTQALCALGDKKLLVRIRHQGKLVPVVGLSKSRVVLAQALFAPASGQFAVFYQRDVDGGYYCLGAGEIVND